VSAHVRWREEAEQDACDVALYIAGDNPRAAARFLDSVEETIRMLAELPGTGRACFFDGPNLRRIRSRPVRGFENWLVFFRPTEAGIEVVRIVHGARDLPPIFGEAGKGESASE
jgi:toxin ParE1/3/4